MRRVNWSALTPTKRNTILQRPLASAAMVRACDQSVRETIEQVRAKGDAALYALTKRWDGVALRSLRVSDAALQQAVEQVDTRAIETMQIAMARIETYHRQLLPKSSIVVEQGVRIERMWRPIERVGLYVPGGTAPLISTLMMIGLPAKIAGCCKRVLCTPPDKTGHVDPHLLWVAQQCGINDIIKLGGAQAIAAMAYGSETVPKVDKLFGPGNRYVTAAKLVVSNDPEGASIDLPAGPSEVMIIADSKANAASVAADLLAQAEHGIDSQAILLTASQSLADEVAMEIAGQLPKLSRCDTIRQALQHSAIIVVDTLMQAVTLSNRYAPEHLMLLMEEADRYLPAITSAGAVFMGDWTPETLGDYVTGSNHVLPTGGYARNRSGLSPDAYFKAITVQRATPEGFAQLAEVAMQLAEMEGLTGHRQAVEKRIKRQEITSMTIIRDDLKTLVPYKAAYSQSIAEEKIWLHANELPWQQPEGMNRYPSQQPQPLIDVMADFYQVRPDQLLVTCGSDEAIDLLMRLCCLPGRDEVLYCPPTFGMYQVCARIQGVATRAVSLKRPDFTFDTEAVLAKGDESVKLVFLCSPNNPTGQLLQEQAVLTLCRQLTGRALVVVDEAYIELSQADSLSRYLGEYDNLVILRTLSKAFGLAGARVGVLLAQRQWIEGLRAILFPYPLPTPSVHLAIEAFSPVALTTMRERIVVLQSEREWLMKTLSALPIIEKVWPSQANFMLLKGRVPLVEHLLSKNIVVRSMAELFDQDARFCRLTVGTPQENRKVLEALNASVEVSDVTTK